MGEDRKYICDIRMDIRQEPYGGGMLSVNHTITVRADGFMALCSILAQVDALATKLDKGE